MVPAATAEAEAEKERKKREKERGRGRRARAGGLQTFKCIECTSLRPWHVDPAAKNGSGDESRAIPKNRKLLVAINGMVMTGR